MKVEIYNDEAELGKAAGDAAARIIVQAITAKGTANIILATGTSQFCTLDNLVLQDVAWDKVTLFHLDEYIGLPETHPASFRKYIKDRFISRVQPLHASYLINGDEEPVVECRRLGNAIAGHPIDLALIGIGENGHIAFNDPPANFQTEEPFIIVNLDEKCRRQQVNEGWFGGIEEVPRQAITMSIRQILKSQHILCSVPGERKAEAVKNTLEKPVDKRYPSTILRTHNYCTCFLDTASAALLSNHNNIQ